MANSRNLIDILKEKNMTISTAESCTGGMIAASIVDCAGASECFKEGYITYANEAKVKILSVNPATLDEYGAVSAQTADEMAKGLLLAADSDYAISVTGIAGPDGGSPQKPVGLVYIAVGVKSSHSIYVKKFNFTGDRLSVRTAARDAAIDMAVAIIEKES